MELTKKKSNRGRIAIIALAVLLAAAVGVAVWLAVWAVQMNAALYDQTISEENAYEDALFQTADGLSTVESALSKLMISQSDAQCAAYAAEICKTAAATADAAARLPVEYEETARLQKFLNQVSDFSVSYIKAAAGGGDLTSYEEQLDSLLIAAQTLKKRVQSITVQFDGTYRITDKINDDGFYADLSGGGDKDSSVDYPRLIYDGPFSDALDEICFKAVAGLGEISGEQAVTVAAELAGLEGGKVSGVVGKSEGALVYSIDGRINGNDASVGITKRGGMISSIEIYSLASAVKYDDDYAREFAKNKCVELGFCEDLTPVWFNKIGAVAYVNLAPVKDDIIYYTDLIVVKVNLTDGSLMGLEARGYCSNYCERDAKYVMDEDAVPTLISNRLTIISIRLAVIPKGQKEVLCYEVATKLDTLDYIVYLDAVTGGEVEILRVIDEDQGAMVY